MLEPERRDLAFIPRWSIVRQIHQQSVAEHCFFVASYGLKIAELIDWPNWKTDEVENREDMPQLLHELALYLLRHDEHEALTGDQPGPIKRLASWDNAKLDKLFESRFGPPPVVTDQMVAIRRVADLLDECLYLAGEYAMGNRTISAVLDNCRRQLNVAIAKLPTDDAKQRDLCERLQNVIDAEINCVKNIDGWKGV